MKVSNEKPKKDKYGVTTEYVFIANNSNSQQSFVEKKPRNTFQRSSSLVRKAEVNQVSVHRNI